MAEPLFFITTMPNSRPADYCLGYLDGCVFIDFNNYHNDKICLRRISFDGYGCYGLGEQAIALDAVDSKNFKDILQNDLKDQNKLLTIVKKAISLNKQNIRTEALIEYGLV